ncbi:hypothetical protein SGFS_100170 [Streptomyces graminofaciens]|uniref:Glycosyl hydrolase family 30 TIM-barrel domain-containing protein n=2 Tax=Streptomyces graminofaciens TaxID=68212 RepID=A0ABN5VZB1_9ACTN|nr:hypothetical protein SGFS_100170 [Streptomyces graminofaciens]
MGSSDYTVTPPGNPGTYSYDDNNGQPDPTLANFSTAHDDAYVIPVIKQAQALNPAMKLFANNWSPPAWMKTTNTMLGTNNGTLRSDMYGPLAQYYVKFLQEYKAKGVKVWGVTPQNEPTISPPSYSAMLGDTKILGGDADHVDLNYADTLLNNQAARDAMYGTAWHCYRDDLGKMTTIHNTAPDKRIYESECSTGPGIAPMNAAQLALESTFNWANGALLWNLALDTSGGPKMGVGCTNCTGLVTVDQATGKATYTDNYYQLGQFSKFVVPGATRIGYTDGGGIWAQAYKNPDGGEVLADGSVTNDLSGLCLDVTGMGTTNGSPVQLWNCTGNPNPEMERLQRRLTATCAATASCGVLSPEGGATASIGGAALDLPYTSRPLRHRLTVRRLIPTCRAACAGQQVELVWVRRPSRHGRLL